jgi:hypothetical protein
LVADASLDMFGLLSWCLVIARCLRFWSLSQVPPVCLYRQSLSPSVLTL